MLWGWRPQPFRFALLLRTLHVQVPDGSKEGRDDQSPSDAPREFRWSMQGLYRCCCSQTRAPVDPTAQVFDIDKLGTGWKELWKRLGPTFSLAL